jgi:hypothetical protein
MKRGDGGRSRVTAVLRLGIAVWLVVSAIATFANPLPALAASPLPEAVQPLAALEFCLGIFLLTGFMSRVAGLLLILLGAWQVLNLGISLPSFLEVAIGAYLMLRGGGAWAMDIYVQKMQDRVRQREALKANPPT